MYLIFCPAGNMMSIPSPVTLKQGLGHPASHQDVRVLYQIMFMLVVPMLMGLALIPLGFEALLAFLKWAVNFHPFLVLGMIQFVVIVWPYRVGLNWQSGLLQRREKKILEIVSLKAE
jgi:hypothetical protein